MSGWDRRKSVYVFSTTLTCHDSISRSIRNFCCTAAGPRREVKGQEKTIYPFGLLGLPENLRFYDTTRESSILLCVQHSTERCCNVTIYVLLLQWRNLNAPRRVIFRRSPLERCTTRYNIMSGCLSLKKIRDSHRWKRLNETVETSTRQSQLSRYFLITVFLYLCWKLFSIYSHF